MDALWIIHHRIFSAQLRHLCVRAAVSSTSSGEKNQRGTQFIQTNLIFDLPRFEAYLEELEKRNLLSRVHLIAGVAPIKAWQQPNICGNSPVWLSRTILCSAWLTPKHIN